MAKTSVLPPKAAELVAFNAIQDLLKYPFDATEYFDFRYDVARHVLEYQQALPRMAVEALVRDAQFWAWFRRIWMINDLRIRDEWLTEFGADFKMERADYQAYQHAFFSNRYVNRTTIESISERTLDPEASKALAKVAFGLNPYFNS